MPTTALLVIDVQNALFNPVPRPFEADAYFQCARALLRSQLWTPAAWPDLGQQPTAGQLLASGKGRGISTPFDGPAYDAALPLRQRDTLY